MTTAPATETAADARFNVVSPHTIGELTAAVNRLRGSNYRFIAGGTDLLLELRKAPERGLTLINLTRLDADEFVSILPAAGGVRIGALTTAAEVAQSPFLAVDFPVLVQAAQNLASRQIRHTATIGGNICTASPAGDLSCALMALNSRVEVLSADGRRRTEPLTGFFTGVRRTSLSPEEVLCGIHLPANLSQVSLSSGFIKVGVRRSMECAVVSLAYHLQLNPSGEVSAAGVAVGSVAPTVARALQAEEFLVGKAPHKMSREHIEQFAALVSAVARPISDLRASAQYRREVLFNISKSILESQ